jgi:hypothetical protein
MNPFPIRETVAAGLLLGVVLAAVGHCAAGCKPSAARPAAYGAELAECTRSSATLAASIECENGVRTRYGRPLRDGGAE